MTATEHPGLFWGLPGGKATLGIVTAVEIELLPITTVHGGSVFFDSADTAAVLHAWASWSADLPDHATTSVAIVELPELPHLPPAISGKRVVTVRYASVTDTELAETTLEPIRTAATALLDGIGEIPAAAIGSIHADPTDPIPVQERQTLLHSLPADAIDTLLDAAGPTSGTPLLVVELRRLGGAISHQPQHPSAVDHRDAAYTLSLMGLAIPPLRDEVAAAAATTLTVLDNWSTGARFVNFGASEDPAEIARAYSPDTFHRLATLARQYDPSGVLATGQVAR